MVSAAKKNSRTENSLIWYNILTKGWSLSYANHQPYELRGGSKSSPGGSFEPPDLVPPKK